MRLKPACGWCNNHDEFVDNPQLKILVQCFKKLCEYVASSAILGTLSSTNNNESNALLHIIQEGMAIKDTYSPPAACPGMGLIPPPKLQKERPESESKRKRRRGKRNSLKIKLRKGQGQGLKGEGTSYCVDPDYPNQVDFNEHNTSREDEVSTTTLTPENDSHPQPDSTHMFNAHKPVGAGVNYDDDLDNVVVASSTVADEDVAPVLGDFGNDILDHQQSPRDIYSTVAAEHDYINREMLSDENDNRNTEELLKAARKSPSRSRKPDNSHIMVKKARVHAVKTEDTSDHNATVVPKGVNSVHKTKSRGVKKGSGCRCGLATPNPGKLTCCGQRCPCYSAFKGCVDCRCRGCRNPRGDYAKLPQTVSSLLTVQSKAGEDSDGEGDIKID